MASKSIILLFLLAASASASAGARTVAVSVEESEPLDGGWQPIENVADPHVVEVAKFAVSAYNKQSGSKLVFKKVESGEDQVVAGMNYHLILVLKNKPAELRCEAVVYEKVVSGELELSSFQVLG